jgi:uncharacterized protein YecT (DUF1311 family)
MNRACLILVAAAAVAGPASAVPRHDALTPPTFCRGGHSGEEFTACEKQELAKQNKALNEIYSRLYAFDRPPQKKILAAAEATWTRFRDADCDSASLLVRYAMPLGDQMREQADERADCLARVTHERVVVLTQRYSDSKAWDPMR